MNTFVGKQYGPRGCWRMVRDVFKGKGVELPAFDDLDATIADLKRTQRLVQENQDKWNRISKPEKGDCVLLRPSHIGVIVDRRRFLHVSDAGDVVIEDFTSNRWRHKIRGFYRYAG